MSAPHPYAGRRPRGPFQKRRDGTVIGPEYVSLSSYATASTTDPGDATRAANKTGILAAVAAAKAQGKALLVDGLYWWDAGSSAGLDLSASKVKIIGRDPRCFGTSVMDGFVGKVSTAPVSPKNGIYLANTDDQELWHLRIAGDGASARGSLPGHHGVYGENVIRLRVANCQAQGATAAGFLFNGFQDLYLANCNTSNSLADAFHVTSGSGNTFPATDAYIENCISVAAGDDCFATVSYGGSNEVDGVTMRRCRSVAAPGNSRIAVIGGKNVLYQAIYPYSTSYTSWASNSATGNNCISKSRCLIDSLKVIRITGNCATA